MTPVNHIAIVDKSEKLDDAAAAAITEAYRAELPRFCEIWGLPVPGLTLYPASHRQAVSEEAALIFVDTTNQADALGWHTALGAAVYGYVDVGMSERDGEPLSRVFGHELFELCLDPSANMWQWNPLDRLLYAKEACDPVQRYSRTRRVDTEVAHGYVEVADFILPAWFDDGNQRGPWSDQGYAPGPFMDAEGGYHLTLQPLSGAKATSGGRVKSFGRTARRLLG